MLKACLLTLVSISSASSLPGSNGSGAWDRKVPAHYADWAATPPMGWNSWDAYGTAVREQDVKANADYMAEHLAKFGWQYIVVDIQWYEPNAKGHAYQPDAKLSLDAFGRLLPAVNRFPSAANGAGFKPLADYVHSKGLKFGIHVMRGIPRQAVTENRPIKGTKLRARDIADSESSCRWNPDMWGVDTTRPGAQAYYDSLAELYASWGVDFIKADDMGSHLFQPAEMKALHRAILKTGRPIVLSISPGPAPLLEAESFQKNAQMWRISDDFWDEWKLLRQQFEFAKDWAPEIGKNNTWPDADMLAIGRLRVSDKGGKGEPTNFTADEQRTMMTLWSIMRSPLIFGGDLPSNDEFTLSLINNPEVIAVDQHSRNNRPVLSKGAFVAWAADVVESQSDHAGKSSGDRYVAVFNLGDTATTVDAAWEDVGVAAKSPLVRDLWQRKDLGAQARLRIPLPPHGSGLLRVRVSRNDSH